MGCFSSKEYFKFKPLKSNLCEKRTGKMEAQHGHSAACCNISPIVSKGYQPKGRYEIIGGTKMCM
jgi:hypothetical protein